jgi:hypothetical protein
MNDGILSGALAIVGTAFSFLTLLGQGARPLEVKGLAAYGSVPTLLVTRSPNVKSIADFTDKDRTPYRRPRIPCRHCFCKWRPGRSSDRRAGRSSIT